MSGEVKTACSVFKGAQVRYRRRPHAPDHVDDLDEIIDFHRALENSRIVSFEALSHCDYQGNMFGLQAYPGFLFAPSALSTDLQAELAYSAVSTYCEAPHVTNIDGIQPKTSEIDNSGGCSIWDLWKTELASPEQKQPKYYRCFRKLTWATLGYHYDWTARAYHEDAKSPMPDVLSRLGKLFATTALQILKASSTKPLPAKDDVSYEATACIVNYYNSKSIMGGHRDDLEQAISKPIVSISLGRPAVFLLGGKTVDCQPVIPVIVRPGDVMVLGGDCRLNYHSMARLLPAQLSVSTTLTVRTSSVSKSHQVQLNDIVLDEESKVFRELKRNGEVNSLESFLSTHRININLRQVYNTTSEG